MAMAPSMDKQGQSPDHGDDDDILVGFIEKEGRCQEENGGGQREKNQERKPLLHFFKKIVLIFLIHTLYII
jgi:hypothetical protein